MGPLPDEPRHFHIHWSDRDKLDWEAFDSFEEALSRALELIQPGENYTIEVFSKNCPVCAWKTDVENR